MTAEEKGKRGGKRGASGAPPAQEEVTPSIRRVRAVANIPRHQTPLEEVLPLKHAHG